MKEIMKRKKDFIGIVMEINNWKIKERIWRIKFSKLNRLIKFISSLKKKLWNAINEQ